MKFLKYLLIIMGIITLGACSNNDDDGLIWEPYPHFVRIDIVDAQGNALMSDKYTGILDKDNLESQISCIFEGETYPLQVNPPYYGPSEIRARDINPQFHAIFLEDRIIRFGDFDGAFDSAGEFTICWPDGTSDKVVYKFTAHLYKKKSTDEVSVNGASWENTCVVKFVK